MRRITYCYNFIEFDWDVETDALAVYILPRAWVNEEKRFDADEVRLGGREPRFILECPNFRNAPKRDSLKKQEVVGAGASDTVLMKNPGDYVENAEEETVSNTYPLLLLRFFRDISPAQRMEILANLGALPPDWTGTLSESIERKAFDGLVEAGRSEELQSALGEIL